VVCESTAIGVSAGAGSGAEESGMVACMKSVGQATRVKDEEQKPWHLFCGGLVGLMDSVEDKGQLLHV